MPLTVEVAEDPAVRLAFTGRQTPANLSLLVGEGDVVTARRDALAAVGAPPERAVFMQQVHGGNVAEVTALDAGRGLTDPADAIPAVDGLVTAASDLALVVLVADCVPVLLVDPGRGVGAVHAGRGGVVAGVAARAAQRLTGGNPAGVVAVIGPAIGGCCYEVPQDMAYTVTREWPQAVAQTTWGTTSLDLPAAVQAQLTAAGVARVERVGGCTRCAPGTWFSHRASTAGAAAPGRQGGVIYRAARDAGGGAPSGLRTRPSLQSP